MPRSTSTRRIDPMNIEWDYAKRQVASEKKFMNNPMQIKTKLHVQDALEIKIYNELLEFIERRIRHHVGKLKASRAVKAAFYDEAKGQFSILASEIKNMRDDARERVWSHERMRSAVREMSRPRRRLDNMEDEFHRRYMSEVESKVKR